MILALPVLLITGCRKNTTEGVSQTVKVSYPEITLNGNALVIVATGATYTDAGAKLKDDITGAITDMEKEPAYKRRNVKLDNVPHSSDNNVSRYTLSSEEDKKSELRQNNSFLHDNVD